MENTLIILQIIFYSVSSLAIIAFFVFIAIVAYRVIKILKALQIIVRDVQDVSEEAKERIKDISEKLSLLPVFSFFMKQAKRGGSSKRKVEKNQTKNQKV